MRETRRFSLWRLFWRTLPVCVLCVLALLVALATCGIPRPVIDRLLQRVNKGGMAVLLGDARFIPFHGVVFRDVRLHRKGVLGPPFLAATEAVLRCNGVALLCGTARPVCATLRAARFRPHMAFDDNRPHPVAGPRMEVELRHVLLVWDPKMPETLTLEDIDAEFRGISVGGSGVLRFRERDAVVVAEEEAAVWSLPWVARLWRYLRELEQRGSARAKVQFFADSNDPDRLEVTVAASGVGMNYPAIRIGNWTANARIDGRTGVFSFLFGRSVLETTTVERLGFQLRYDPDGLRVEGIDCLLHAGGRPGTVMGGVTYRWGADTVEFDLVTACEPRVVLPWIPDDAAGLVEFIEGFQFPDEPPVCSVALRLYPAETNRLECSGKAGVGRFSYRSVTNLGATARFTFERTGTNAVLTMPSFRVRREEGTADGRMVQDLARRTAEIAAVSSLDPKASATMIGPFLEEIVSEFTFGGPVEISVSGTIDYDDWAGTELSVTAEGADIGLLGFVAERAHMRMRLREQVSNIERFEGVLYGGPFSGHAEFRPQFGGTGTAYRVACRLEDADFRSVVRALDSEDTYPYKGRLAVSAEIEGVAGEGNGKTAVGAGKVTIGKGHLFEIPLFGGLTSTLAKLVPGFRHVVSQTDASGSFVIRDGKVRSDDVRIEGTILSIKGRGDYYFDERLDFHVQIRLLSDHSLVGRAMNVIAMPVSKLFEFTLGGTWSRPRWFPAIIPEKFAPAAKPRAEPGAEAPGSPPAPPRVPAIDKPAQAE